MGTGAWHPNTKIDRTAMLRRALSQRPRVRNLPPHSEPLDLLILGAGPTGLGAGWRAEALGRLRGRQVNWRILEAGAGAGGLAASEVDAAGFRWDLGGHVIYSHYADFDGLLAELFEPSELRAVERSRWIWLGERLVPYPVQRNVHRLPAELAIECLDGLLEAWRTGPGEAPFSSFADWYERSFGAGLSRHFFHPFNTKMWATDPRRMAVEWTGARSGSGHANVPTVDVRRLMEHMVHGSEDRGWTPDQCFPYPVRGGTGEIWRRLFATLPAERVMLGARAVCVHSAARELEVESGERLPYRNLVSTLPLDQFAALVPERPEWLDLARGLAATQCHLVGFGFEGRPPAAFGDASWIYFPEEQFPFFRATVLSRYAPENVPDPERHWSLLLECSGSSERPLDPVTIVERCENSLANAGLLGHALDGGPARIATRWHKYLPRAYPIPTADRERYLVPLHAALEAAGIRSRGRFGGWRYEVCNQDHAFMQGVEATDAALLGAAERTLHHPEQMGGYLPALPLPL